MDCELVHDEVVAALVELLGGDPGLHERLDHVEHARRQAPGRAHFVLFGGRLDRHVHRSLELCFQQGSWYNARPLLTRTRVDTIGRVPGAL